MVLIFALLAGFYVSVMVDSKIALEEGSERGFQSQISGTNEVGVFRKLPFNSPGVGGGGDRQEQLEFKSLRVYFSSYKRYTNHLNWGDLLR